MSKAPKSSRKGRKSYLLRLPTDLHSKVAEVANRERRTFQAQVAWILERWLDSHGKGS